MQWVELRGTNAMDMLQSKYLKTLWPSCMHGLECSVRSTEFYLRMKSKAHEWMHFC